MSPGVLVVAVSLPVVLWLWVYWAQWEEIRDLEERVTRLERELDVLTGRRRAE